MMTCIELTIEELQARIAKMSAVVETLRELQPPAPPSTPYRVASGAVPRVEKANRQSPNPELAGKQKSAKAPARALGGVGARTRALKQQRHLIEVARRLPEPITAMSLQKAAGLGLSNIRLAAGALWRWEKRSKWVKRTGRGQYERTKLFPKGDDKAPADDGAGSVSERLAAARRDLADARAKNEPTAVRIAADLIAELEAEMNL